MTAPVMLDCPHCGSCADPDHCVWAIACPACGAGPGEQCRRPGGLAPLHRERWDAAAAVAR